MGATHSAAGITTPLQALSHVLETVQSVLFSCRSATSQMGADADPLIHKGGFATRGRVPVQILYRVVNAPNAANYRVLY